MDGFEWDAQKAETNFQKHGVRFSTEAVSVFTDDQALVISEESDANELRLVALGMGLKARLLAVVYTYRGENIRIISARPATPGECRQYEEQR